MQTIDGNQEGPRAHTPRRSGADRIFRAVFLLLCTLALAIFAFATLAPVLGNWASALLSGMCHQRAERTLHAAGESMGLCARCVGIYGGFAVVGFIYLFGRQSPWYRRLAMASLVAPAVFGLEQLIGWQSGNVARLIVGLALGLWLGFTVNWLLRN